MKKQTAFTLAETLVTLMIIGVIASMTIPALRRSAENRELATKFIKNFSTIAQATELITQDYGAIRRWPNGEIANYYKEHLNIAKVCPPETGCYSVDIIKMQNGRNDIAYGDSGLLLADGTGIKISGGAGGGFASYGIDPDDKAKTKATMQIDVNGPDKPNQWGTDIFLFVLIDGKGLVPSGTFSESGCRLTYGCASYILRTGKLDL